MSIMPAGIICYLKLTSPGFWMYLWESFRNLCHDSLYGDLWLVLLAGCEDRRHRSVGEDNVDTYFDIYGDPWGGFWQEKWGGLPPEAGNPEEKKLFIWIALTGNIIGMLLTFQSGGDKVYSSGYRMEKEETGAYEEKFKVSVDGEEAGSLYVQVPEKETEGSEEEPETELSEEQQREKELQDMIVQYNQ